MICAVLALMLAATPAKPVHAKPRPYAAAPGHPGRYSRWIEDLPLMPGLTETRDGYSFEIFQGGRLAEARLAGAKAPEAVRRFYRATLPALGWRPSPGEPYAWKRGRERLILHVSPIAAARGARAVFVLTPEGGGKPPAHPVASKDVL